MHYYYFMNNHKCDEHRFTAIILNYAWHMLNRITDKFISLLKMPNKTHNLYPKPMSFDHKKPFLDKTYLCTTLTNSGTNRILN